MFRNNLPPIHFHPIFMIYIFLSFLTGTFLELSIIFSIVFIHEMGHYFAAKAFKWRIKKIMLWVFGGVMETDEHGTKPLKEEVFVTIAGPLQHLFIYVIISLLFEFGWLSEIVFELAMTYNLAILLFNLLPIWPLDGGKLLLSFLSMKLPYRISLNITLYCSIILIGVLLIGQVFLYTFIASFTGLLLFLFMENYNERRRRMYVFIRFLLSRYEGRHAVIKREAIFLSVEARIFEAFKQFKRDKKHTIVIRKDSETIKQVDEAECLHAYFYEKQHNQKIIEL